MSLWDIIKGGPREFEPPMWHPFLDRRWKKWALEQKGQVGAKEAFYAGWRACMEELEQSSYWKPIMKKLYAARDPVVLGDYYVGHVDAMTREGLHSKAVIAAELAYRDFALNEALGKLDAAVKHGNEVSIEWQKRCDELQSRLDSLQAAVRSYLNATVHDTEQDAAWHLLAGAIDSSLVVGRDFRVVVPRCEATKEGWYCPKEADHGPDEDGDAGHYWVRDPDVERRIPEIPPRCEACERAVRNELPSLQDIHTCGMF